MIPGYGSNGLRGKLEISSKDYVESKSYIKTSMFETISRPRVNTITELISKNRRERYIFTENWEGCRYWVYTFITDLEAAGIIARGSGATAWTDLSMY
jgi:hypothetical protein